MGIFFKDKPKEVKEAPKAASVKPMPTIATIPTSGGSDYNAHLYRVMEENNQEGLDYFEFANALAQLDGQPLAENQKYIATFPSYKAMGVSAEKLISSAEGYINVLDKEKDEFDKELNNSKDVGITAKQKQIETLTKEIQEKTTLIGKLNIEMSNSQTSLAREEMAFNVAYTSRVNLINYHIEKIKTYLQNDK